MSDQFTHILFMKDLHLWRSSHHRCSMKKDVIRDSDAGVVNFAKFLRIPFFTEHLQTTASISDID